MDIHETMSVWMTYCLLEGNGGFNTRTLGDYFKQAK
jgi:hypothetical protein